MTEQDLNVESMNEEVPGSIVVIHPGSHYLKIGRPSDAVPHSVLHALACKHKNGAGSYADKFLVPFNKLDRQTAVDIEECRLKASHLLQSSLMSDGTRRFATPCQQIAAFNKRCEKICDENEEPSPDFEEMTQEYIVGDNVLKLKPNSDYNIHFPYKKGDFNLHKNVGGSITSVLSHLHIIWSYCITEILKIPEEEIKNHKAVLVIPDIYERSHVKALMNLLLKEIGFSACFVFQEHVAATFGAGLGAACVVDVGEEKTSISCVEDAISQPSTRIRLTYGGGDITQLFHWLLKKSSFPHDFNLNNKQDILLLDQLKKDFCHLNLDNCGAEEKTVTIREPGKRSVQCNVIVGDEALIAPLSFFMVDLLRLTGTKKIIYQSECVGDPEDPFDDSFLREVGRLKNKEVMESSGLENMETTEEDIIVDDQGVGAHRSVENCTKSEDKLISIEQAILASIEKCSSEEMKRKMYQTILVVGGGAKFTNFGKWLHDRLSLHIPVSYRSDPIDVITRPKDQDPSMTSWKGASLMSGLEGSSELWIHKREWLSQGVKVLREKCPFIW